MPRKSALSALTEGCNNVACKNCNMFQLCLPIGSGEADLSLLDKVIKWRKPIKRGEYLFRAGSPFLFIYAVKSGSLKTCLPMEGTNNHVIGFQLPGEVLGLDAISTGAHQCSAVALETTSVCEVPFNRLEELGEVVASVQRQALRIMSRQLQHDQVLQTLLCRKTADERLAAFLVSLSARFALRGFSETEYHISMSRQDIGSYLGLAEETVSRLLSRFQAEGLLGVNRKHVKIHDLARLRHKAGEPEIRL